MITESALTEWLANPYTDEYARVLRIALRSVGCLILDTFDSTGALALETHLRGHLIERQNLRGGTGSEKPPPTV